MSSQPIHNFSSTIDVIPSMNSTFTKLGEELGQEDRPRKRSVPPVHIPLLDFSKLNQPRPSVAKKEQAKVAGKDQIKANSKPYTTIEPRAKSALQMSAGDNMHGSNSKHASSVERPLDFANQKHIAAFESSGKFRIDLHDVQRMPKKTLTKEEPMM